MRKSADGGHAVALHFDIRASKGLKVQKYSAENNHGNEGETAVVVANYADAIKKL